MYEAFGDVGMKMIEKVFDSFLSIAVYHCFVPKVPAESCGVDLISKECIGFLRFGLAY